MGLYIEFDVKARLSKEAERVLVRWARFDPLAVKPKPRRTDRVTIGFFESESVPWKLVFARLEREGASIPPESLDAVDSDFDWKRKADQCAAAVLTAGDVLPAANPPEDYDPVLLPEPHRGFLPPGKPVHVVEKPRGHLVEVGEDLIMSEKLARVVGRSKQHVDQKVILKGEVLSGWTRLLADEKCRVISDASFGPKVVACTGCGAKMRPSLGVWLAVERPDLNKGVAADVSGYDHLGGRHPIVISVELASFLSREFRTGLAVAPVYAWHSKTAQVVREILAGVKRLAR